MTVDKELIERDVFRFTQPGKYTVRITVPPCYSATTTSIGLEVKQFETGTASFIVTKA